MKKYLRVSIDNGSGQSVVVYEELDGDESDVPEDERG